MDEQTLTVVVTAKAATNDEMDKMEREILAAIDHHYDLGFLDAKIESKIERKEQR